MPLSQKRLSPLLLYLTPQCIELYRYFTSSNTDFIVKHADRHIHRHTQTHHTQTLRQTQIYYIHIYRHRNTQIQTHHTHRYTAHTCIYKYVCIYCQLFAYLNAMMLNIQNQACVVRLFALCKCVGTHMPWHTCDGQRAICGSPFFPPTCEFWGLGSGQAWQQAPYGLSHFSSPEVIFFLFILLSYNILTPAPPIPLLSPYPLYTLPDPQHLHFLSEEGRPPRRTNPTQHSKMQ